jgi:hypothetical protein
VKFDLGCSSISISNLFAPLLSKTSSQGFTIKGGAHFISVTDGELREHIVKLAVTVQSA